jgi:hypothetical protein
VGLGEGDRGGPANGGRGRNPTHCGMQPYRGLRFSGLNRFAVYLFDRR